jgi:predicted transcriptional regulator
MIASTEYENGTGIVPNKIFIQWYEENIFLTWDLSEIKINLGINPSYWIMPNMKNSINMAE